MEQKVQLGGGPAAPFKPVGEDKDRSKLVQQILSGLSSSGSESQPEDVTPEVLSGVELELLKAVLTSGNREVGTRSVLVLDNQTECYHLLIVGRCDFVLDQEGVCWG